jgi:hypothetical protein
MQESDSENGNHPQRDSLMGEVEYEVAIAEVVARADNTLHIFDTNLALGGYTSLRRFEALRDFLLRSNKNRLVIVLHETGFLTSRCPRLMQLLKSHSHAVSIHETQEHARMAGDPFVIADESYYVHRFHRDGARFLRALHDPAGALELEGRFQQLLESSYPAVFATTLGL